ncbi:interleukin-1 alpha [Loxodonta africana]|uniref:Interleukin-1 n=1 Tax=Loxodonta africana TaxID=9785 RepID=G3SN89_LOXAF|nr:interleukin-1 alpha [Loxodonta africana]XP_023412796.1 interleukin-1 alpha [Loxodonta africana]
MAKVPDLFEDLKDCYSENEEYSSNNDTLSLIQKSFYDANYGPLQEVCMDKFMSLSTSETSKIAKPAFKESVAVVSATGKILKKRRLSLNQPITDEDLEAIANDPEEEIIESKSAFSTFQNKVKYGFTKTIKSQCILNDILAQSLIRDPTGPYLKAAALNNLDNAVKFDIGAYKPADGFNIPVTLRISKTRLFVSAQDEGEPLLLKEMPETPKVIIDETNLLFLWENHGIMHYFRSMAHPELFIATKNEERVHLARGQPSTIDFKIWDN